MEFATAPQITTPSKQVLLPPHAGSAIAAVPPANIHQAAADLESLKVQSPPKQPVFTSTEQDDWDDSIAKPIEGLPRLGASDAVAAAEGSIASTIKSDEADEPLLRENPNRFVLFPIRYHEVRVRTRQTRV